MVNHQTWLIIGDNNQQEGIDQPAMAMAMVVDIALRNQQNLGAVPGH